MELSPDLVDDPIFEVISRLSDCLCSELAAANGPALCYCGLWVGTEAPPVGYADCTDGKECGAAWVRLVTGFPSTVFPIPDQGVDGSGAVPLAFEVEIGVARCAPRAQGRELFPSKQSLFEAQRLYASDMRASRRALMCCLPQVQKAAGGFDIQVGLGLYTPLENAAGKSGGSWQGFIGRA
jgi:hypothetical protein